MARKGKGAGESRYLPCRTHAAGEGLSLRRENPFEFPGYALTAPGELLNRVARWSRRGIAQSGYALRRAGEIDSSGLCADRAGGIVPSGLCAAAQGIRRLLSSRCAGIIERRTCGIQANCSACGSVASRRMRIRNYGAQREGRGGIEIFAMPHSCGGRGIEPAPGESL